eukprot:4103617-Lingulodinium_polyedra.AAC.1
MPLPAAEGGGFVTGDAALARPDIQDVVGPAAGAVLEAVIPSGVKWLFRKLETCRPRSAGQGGDLF